MTTVNGKWGPYGAYSKCSKDCGGGIQSRTRACNNPVPKYGGKQCSGSATDSRACNTRHCPGIVDYTVLSKTLVGMDSYTVHFVLSY